eukprot:9385029-Karenia_brevis.AAC.1
MARASLWWDQTITSLRQLVQHIGSHIPTVVYADANARAPSSDGLFIGWYGFEKQSPTTSYLGKFINELQFWMPASFEEYNDQQCATG